MPRPYTAAAPRAGAAVPLVLHATLAAALAAVLTSAAPQGVRAQVAPVTPPRDSARRDTTPRGLAPVVVTATRTRRTLGDLPVSASVVPRAVVEATPAPTVDDLLRTVPGLDIRGEDAVVAHPTSNFVSMRGLGGIRTLVLLDGVPLNDPFFGYVPWNKVPPALVDHVEVVRGGASNLFGTYALGGVVNIITRAPREDGEAAEASYGSNATGRLNLFASRALSDALRVTVDGDYFNTGGYLRPYPGQIGPLDRPGRSATGNVYARVEYAPSRDLTAFVRAGYYRLSQNQGSPLGTVGQRALDLVAGGERRFAGGGTLAVRAFTEGDRMFTNNTDPVTARGVDEFLSNAHVTPAQDVGGSVQFTQPLAAARTVVTAGVDARTITGEDRADVYSVRNVYAYREVGGGTQRTLGAFAQGDWFATGALELVASARLDAWQNVNAHLYRVNGAPGAGESNQYPERSKTRLNPKLAARYRLGGGFTARAAAYEAFNAPNLDQLYRPYSSANFAAVPNAALGPETLRGADAGVEYARGGAASGAGAASVQLNAFSSALRDVITYNVISGPNDPVYVVKPVNAGRLRSRGAELFGTWNPAGAVRLGAGYTFTDATITENPGDPTLVGKTPPDTPKHEFEASAGYLPASGATAFLRGRYLTRRYTDASDARALSPHFVLDASASAPLTALLPGGARGTSLALFVQAENVLDRLYVATAYGFDARGTPRQVFVGLRAGRGEGGR